MQGEVTALKLVFNVKGDGINYENLKTLRRFWLHLEQTAIGVTSKEAKGQ